MTIEPPHLKVLARLNRARVDYVLIGVMAVSHYADDPSEAYFTRDCDVLVRPDLRSLRSAVHAALAEGYELRAGGEPLPDPDDLTLRRILGHRANVIGERPGRMSVDLVLDAGGMSFAEWWKGRRLFKVGRLRIPCAALDKLLLAKERAGRPKDRAFLKLYRAMLETKRQRGAKG